MPRPDPADVSRVDVDGRSEVNEEELHTALSAEHRVRPFAASIPSALLRRHLRPAARPKRLGRTRPTVLCSDTAPPRRLDPTHRRTSTSSRCSSGATRACARRRTTSTKGASTCSAAARPRFTASTRGSPAPWTSRLWQRRASRRRMPRRSWPWGRRQGWASSSAS